MIIIIRRILLHTVHVMRGGAPDKCALPNTDNIKFIKHNNCNLASLDINTIKKLCSSGYILSADEGDIYHVNKLRDIGEISEKIARKILLPFCSVTNHIIDYISFIPKDSHIYSDITNHTDGLIKYENYISYDIDKWRTLKIYDDCAIKTNFGSGSRGILLKSKYHYDKGIPGYKDKIETNDIKGIVSYLDSYCNSLKIPVENRHLLVQKLIPPTNNDGEELRKVNVDFVIRKGKLLGYKWGLPEPGSNFTNWNWVDIIHDDYTDNIMSAMEKYLVNIIGITDAIMNFEAFSDMRDNLYLVEFNWRYSNSAFESHAFGFDLVECYLTNTKFSTPTTSTGIKLCRTWNPILLTNLEKDGLKY